MPTNTPPIDMPSPKGPHSGPDSLFPTPNDKPGNKKGLWIGLGIAAAVIVALLLLLIPKQEPASTDPDTQAYEACQTVADYRAYISDYGRNSMHYADAKTFIDQYVLDSVKRVQDSLAKVQAQQQAEAEALAQAEAEKKEDAAYKKCTTIAACDNYLNKYPQGRYEKEVKKIKDQLKKKDEEGTAFDDCFTVAGCNTYLQYYPNGDYVNIVKSRKQVLEAEERKGNKDDVSIYFHKDNYDLPAYYPNELYQRIIEIAHSALEDDSHLYLRSSRGEVRGADLAEDRCRRVMVELMRMGVPEDHIIIEPLYFGNKQDRRVLIHREKSW